MVIFCWQKNYKIYSNDVFPKIKNICDINTKKNNKSFMLNRGFFFLNIFLSIGERKNTRHAKFTKYFKFNFFENSS
jgi:hypothetical protein